MDLFHDDCPALYSLGGLEKQSGSARRVSAAADFLSSLALFVLLLLLLLLL